MSIKCKFDVKKAIEAILLVATQSKKKNMYNVLKILYFADKEHLARYGRLIYGDSYVAMRLGPVPSGAYDIVKYARGDGIFSISEPVENAFAVEGHEIIPLREANVELLSESDIECLDEAISRYGHLSFGRLKTLSHQDPAFQKADRNLFIPLEEIVQTLPDSDLLLDYLMNA